MSNLPEGPWSFELDRDPESADFTLSTISVDADDEGRLRDYGRSIIEGMITDPTIDILALGELLSQAPTLAATVTAQQEVIGALVGALRGLLAWAEEGRADKVATTHDPDCGCDAPIAAARAALKRARSIPT